MAVAAVALGGAVIYELVPTFAAICWEHKMNSFVKVQANYPGCTPGREAWSQFRCQCEFVFEDERDPSKISFQGSGLQYSYEPKIRTYRVSGVGTLRNGSNRVEFKSDIVIVNATEIPPDRPSSFYVLIKRDGSLLNSRPDFSW